MTQIKKFIYNEKEITFDFGNEDVMINATEMAKVFGKRPAKWLELPSAISFLDALTTIRKSDSEHFQGVVTINGGLNPGTWMHEDVAIEFARWLSPGFSVWCNDRIKELMKHGATAINPEDLLNPDFVISVMNEIKKERAEKAILEEESKKNKPFVDFAKTVSEVDECLKIEDYAKVIYKDTKMGRNKLFEWMRDKGILQLNNKPYQKYITAGYFKVSEKTFDRGGVSVPYTLTLITGKGQIAIHRKFMRDESL